MRLHVIAKVTAKTLIKEGDPKTYKGRARKYITTELPSYEGEKYIRYIFNMPFDLELDEQEYRGVNLHSVMEYIRENLKQYINIDLWEIKITINQICYTSW